MNEKKMNWATAAHYELVKKFLASQNQDVKNTYNYKNVLEAKGFDVYMADLASWIKSSDVEIDKSSIDALDLDVEVA